MQTYRIDGARLKPVTPANLEIGQILWLNGYGQSEHSHDRKVIYGREDNKYGAMFLVVNVDKLTLERQEANYIRPASEIFGIGTYYTPGDVFENIAELPAIVEQARENERVLKLRSEKEATDKAERIRIEREALPAMYPYLKTAASNPKTSSHALGSKNLRAELAKEFPGVMFSVRSESYSGGDSINVHWTDGPTTKEVEFFSEKYQECDFNGMEDLETYRNAVFPSVFGGAKYVSESRTVSPARYVETGARLGYTITTDEHGTIQAVDFHTRELIQRETWATSYYKKP